MFFTVLGLLSAAVFLACDFPYLLDAIRAKIKPHRVTWGVAVTLNAIGFANQWAIGATNSLWVIGAAVLMTGAIFAASFKNGTGGTSKLDIFAITASLIGVLLWFVFDSPLFSIFANIFVATVGLIPTLAKARHSPETETRIAWLGGTISTALATVSVGKLDWKLLITPISSTILQGIMVYLLYVRVKRHPKK